MLQWFIQLLFFLIVFFFFTLTHKTTYSRGKGNNSRQTPVVYLQMRERLFIVRAVNKALQQQRWGIKAGLDTQNTTSKIMKPVENAARSQFNHNCISSMHEQLIICFTLLLTNTFLLIPSYSRINLTESTVNFQNSLNLRQIN